MDDVPIPSEVLTARLEALGVRRRDALGRGRGRRQPSHWLHSLLLSRERARRSSPRPRPLHPTQPGPVDGLIAGGRRLRARRRSRSARPGSTGFRPEPAIADAIDAAGGATRQRRSRRDEPRSGRHRRAQDRGSASRVADGTRAGRAHAQARSVGRASTPQIRPRSRSSPGSARSRRRRSSSTGPITEASHRSTSLLEVSGIRPGDAGGDPSVRLVCEPDRPAAVGRAGRSGRSGRCSAFTGLRCGSASG